MAGSVQKICCVCATDVCAVPRTKDPRGNYYCKPCYGRLVALRHRRAIESEAAAAAAVETAQLPGTVDVEPIDAGAAPRELPTEGTQIAALAGSKWGLSLSIGHALSKAAGALAILRPASDDEHGHVVHAPARRVKKRVTGAALRLSDLVGEEAQAEFDAAGVTPWMHEPEVPVSPITNPPVSALVDEYAELDESDRQPNYGDEADELIFPIAITAR